MTVLLVPRRDDRGHRDKLWKWCKARWERLMPDVPIVEGHHTVGPFNRSAAINEAARLAGDWDVAVVIDSDVFVSIPHVRAAIDRAQAGAVTWAHRRWRGISEADTTRLLKFPESEAFGQDPTKDRDIDLIVEKTTAMSWSCCVAIPRATFDAIGGFDERFRGWGFEDGAWSALVRALYRWDRIEGDIYHLWHPRSDERIILGQSGTTASADYVRNALLGRRYMIASIRDHRIGDQPGEERLSAEMAETHVRNLTKDDNRFLGLARGRQMPEADWMTWWPTLEELRDGWIAERDAPPPEPTITVVVHTGGSPETWPERSAYLRRSLASLSDNVTGPIIQRVVYSDWGPDHLEELTAIANGHGFYVAGTGHHGYTGSMRRMWLYLARRAQGDYIFGTEDDFTYQPVDLGAMARTLRDNPELAQVALLRDAFYQDERETGGVLGWPEPAFTKAGENGTTRLEHSLFWTANPSVFPKAITLRPWPMGRHSETLFGKELIASGMRFAFWGDHVELTQHIGTVRAGTGY